MTPVTNKSIEYIDTINPITAHRLPDKKRSCGIPNFLDRRSLKKGPQNNAALYSLLTTCICVAYLKVQACVSRTEATMT